MEKRTARKDKKFEEIATKLHQYLFPRSSIKPNQKLLGRSGVKRQVDILIEDAVAAYPIKVIVDCKHYSSKVDINEVGKVWDLVDDIRANLGVIVSNAGFTKGAIKRADELGRLKLCSVLDLEHPKFSIKLSLPVICEFRKPRYQIKVSSSDPNFSVTSGHPAYILIEDQQGKVSSIYNEFIALWNEGKISHELGKHVTRFSPDEWKILGPNGRAKFTELKIHYEVVPRFYLGFTPLIEGKGIVDIQENTLKTTGFITGKIDAVDVEKNWEQFEERKDIKVKPVFHLVASDLFKPVSLDIKKTEPAK